LIDSNIQTGIVEIPLSAEGTADQNTTDARVSAAFSVVDSFNGNSVVIPVTRIEGITRALITPGGTGNVFLGQGAVMDFSGAQVPASVTRAPAAMVALLGEAGAGVAGGSRSTAMLRLREILDDARDYGVNKLAYNARNRRDYARGRLDLEALQPVLKGQVPLAIQANRASDLLTAIRLADEFKVRLVLIGAAEGWMVARQLADAKVPVVVKPLTDIPSFDSLGATLENAARLSRAGVTVALASFDTQNSRLLRQEAGNAIANGMDRDAALRAVTLTPAQLWGVADRVGSLEAGKDADLVIWSGDPFELDHRGRRVFIKGVRGVRGHPPESALNKYRDAAAINGEYGGQVCKRLAWGQVCKTSLRCQAQIAFPRSGTSNCRFETGPDARRFADRPPKPAGRLHPVQRPLRRLLPPGVTRIALIADHCGSQRLSMRQLSRRSSRSFQNPTASPAHRRRRAPSFPRRPGGRPGRRARRPAVASACR
jgi:hypothetical protein